ncbi:TIGR00341 family protein [Motiliproteus sediminis]|uniref:TIGR00341 family protein n=1 Tax=Motiliproteus sediminis TaxID=1468178 RepID=UPI001AEF677C|nr:TIGR00341 family protein [Motiliproteus sediminis]
MKYVEVVARSASTATLLKIGDRANSVDTRLGVEHDDGMRTLRFLIPEHRLQKLVDELQYVLGAQQAARITVLPVELALPEAPEQDRAREDAASTAREALFDQVQRNTHLNPNFLVLVTLSTLVAAIGMIEDNVAVIIGGMVIAPLLGPNLALSLGTALGSSTLIRQSALALTVGLLFSVVIGLLIAIVWPEPLQSSALQARTNAGLIAAILALASGAAAALSLTSGLSSALVGVMVAVALLPPATALGIMLGQQEWPQALGAFLLLTIDVVCINLACKLVFLLKGVHPRAGEDKRAAERSMLVYIVAWCVTLAILVAASYGYQQIPA